MLQRAEMSQERFNWGKNCVFCSLPSAPTLGFLGNSGYLICPIPVPKRQGLICHCKPTGVLTRPG